MPLPVPRAAVAGLALVALAGAASGEAQVIERNLPPASAAAPTTLPTPQPSGDADAAPIGPALAAIVAIGPTDAVRAGGSGIDLRALPRLDTPAGRGALRPLLGQPLSRRLIAQAKAAITGVYRAAGFPFVSVTAPEQEIGGGVLQLRVIEFRAGRIAATGGRRTSAGEVRRRIRQRGGAPIDAWRLSEDLDWLNRAPFRQVAAQFSPGTALGLSDLALPVVEQRPWRVYGGAATSGSPATGAVRLIAGVQATGLPGLGDGVLSYQATASPDLLSDHRPSYLSHAARLTLPVAARRAIEISYDHVDTLQPVEAFISRQRVDEAAIDYRVALSDLLPHLRTAAAIDVTAGVEARRAARRLLFGDTAVTGATADIVQLYLGTEASASDARGRTTLSAAVHLSPGGIGRRNRAAALASYAGDPDATARYAYVGGGLGRATRLPHGWTVTDDLAFQYSTATLPATERAAIGGPGAVRGYTLDDGGFDSVAVLRNALFAPAIALPQHVAGGATIQPRLLFDLGEGRDRTARRWVMAVSAGAGADYRLGTIAQIGADAACALADAPHTRAGHCRVEARITLGI